MLASGRSRELVIEGALDPNEMDEAVRKKTGQEATFIKRAVLERDGHITIETRQGDSVSDP